MPGEAGATELNKNQRDWAHAWIPEGNRYLMRPPNRPPMGASREIACCRHQRQKRVDPYAPTGDLLAETHRD